MKIHFCARYLPATVLAALAWTQPVNAAPQAPDLPYIPGDELCLHLAAFGEQVALARSEGMTEEKIYAKAGVDRKSNDKGDRLQKNIISYVFTVELKPTGSRKTIFSKCKAGAF